MRRLMLWLYLFFPCSLPAAQIIEGVDSYSRIGSGLEGPSQQWRPACLDGVIQPASSNRSLQFKIYAAQSAEEILEDQRGYGSAKVDFFVVGAKARSEFILRNSESRTQASVLYSVDYRGGSVVFGQRRLNARGQAAAQASGERQRQLCGDQFILSAALGARFYLAASLVFDSVERYRYFKTKVSASAFGGMLKKEKKSVEEVRELAQGAHLSVQAFQAGGQTFDLDLLAATQVSYCPMEKLDPCLDRFAAFHSYAFGASGFRAHVDPQKPEEMAVLWLNASAYADAGHLLRAEAIPAGQDPGFVDLSERLFLSNQRVQQSMNRSAALSVDPGRTDAERASAQIEYSRWQSRAAAVRSAADACVNQDDYQACKSRLDAIDAMVASP